MTDNCEHIENLKQHGLMDWTNQEPECHIKECVEKKILSELKAELEKEAYIFNKWRFEISTKVWKQIWVKRGL